MHVPVLSKEVLFYLDAKKGEKFIDCTAGGGGHIFALNHVNPKAQILGIDLDQASQDNLQKEVGQRGLGQKVKLVRGNYKDIDKIADAEQFGALSGILADLGFSSDQLEDSARGFSFQQDSPLDMRFDQNSRLTAAEVINRYHQKELEKVILELGEERFYRRIASNIVASRKTKPIETTAQLAQAVRTAIPAPVRFKAADSIRRVFQAVRIEVNSELENLKAFLPKALNLLAPNGRLVIISFHSLEDRIVKEFFRQQAKDCVCPPSFPTCVCDKASVIRILTRKPVTASEGEIAENPRSRPAKLRAAEKLEIKQTTKIK
jgi:16S rRNA (cytosine1402-N4)-methyltransferase